MNYWTKKHQELEGRAGVPSEMKIKLDLHLTIYIQNKFQIKNSKVCKPFGFPLLKYFCVFFLLGCLCFPSWFAGVGFLQVLDESFITYIYCNYLLSLWVTSSLELRAFKKRLFSHDCKMLTMSTQGTGIIYCLGTGKRSSSRKQCVLLTVSSYTVSIIICMCF